VPSGGGQAMNHRASSAKDQVPEDGRPARWRVKRLRRLRRAIETQQAARLREELDEAAAAADVDSQLAALKAQLAASPATPELPG